MNKYSIKYTKPREIGGQGRKTPLPRKERIIKKAQAQWRAQEAQSSMSRLDLTDSSPMQEDTDEFERVIADPQEPSTKLMQSFLVDLLGNNLSDCTMKFDNAKLPSERAIDFDAIKIEALLYTSDSSGRWDMDPATPAQQAVGFKAPARKASIKLIESPPMTLSSTLKAGAILRRSVNTAAPKPPRRHSSNEGDEVFDFRRLNKRPGNVRRKKINPASN